MVRTQIYITEEEKLQLKKLSRKTGKSQSELIRDAIDSYVESNQQSSEKSSLLDAFGMWEDNDYDFEEARNTMDRA